jgi:hypothetical protein
LSHISCQLKALAQYASVISSLEDEDASGRWTERCTFIGSSHLPSTSVKPFIFASVLLRGH